MNRVTINGRTITTTGNNIVVTGDKILIDGDVMQTGLSGTVTVKFEGNLASLECADAEINGNVHGNVNAADVRCGDVGGNVNGADVKCGDIAGKVNAASVKMRKAKK